MTAIRYPNSSRGDPLQLVATGFGAKTICLGGPGTGKTTLLAERAAWLIASGAARPEQVLVLAPSRRAAEAVARLARQHLGGGQGPQASSFAALALALLPRHYRALGYSRPPRVLDTSEQRQTIREVLTAEDPAAWGTYTYALGRRVLQTLAYDTATGAAENGLDPEELRWRGEAAGAGVPLRELAAFYPRYRAFLRARHLVDFGHLQAEVARLLSQLPAVAEECQRSYPFLLVDEFEEATYAQACLLEGLVGPQTGLLVAGDPEQAIGSFRGGSPTYLLDLGERLGARVVHLEGRHRGGEGLHRFWAALRPGGQAEGAPGEPAPAAAQPAKGSVVLRIHPYLSDEARWLASQIERLLHAKTKPAEIAVVFRTLGTPLARLLQAELKRRDIPYCIPTEGASVAQPLLRATFDLLAYLAGGAPAEAALLRLLDSPLGGLPPFGLDEVHRLAALADLPLAQWLDSHPDAWKASPALREALVALRERLGTLKAQAGGSVGSLLWEIWRAFPAFAEDARTGGTASRAYAALLGEVARLEEGGCSLSITALRERLERGDFDGLTAPAGQQAGVAITTVHRAKGCEWPVVFLPDLTEGSLPIARSALDLVAPLLLRDLAIPSSEADLAAEVARRHLEEERRIFYVAASRAQTTLYLSYSRTGADGTSALLPSRFLGAVTACPVVRVENEGQEELPLHPLGALAHYRAFLRSPDPLLRAQALYAIDRLRQAQPALVRPAQWWENVAETIGGAPPFPEGRLYLSASRLGAYRECPLAYQYAHHWRLWEPAGTPATVGSLLHAVLEEYHRPGSILPRGREVLQSLLEERFQESQFPYRPVARQAKRNLEKLLDLYYDRYGLDGPALAVEQRFTFAFGPHVVNGFIDRIDCLPSGELELIDYKSGDAMKHDDATADLQLALYDLAFYEDQALGALGRPAKVSYIYPKAIGKTAKADGKRSYQPTDQTRAYLRERMAYYAQAMLEERFPSHFELAEAFADLDPAELERIVAKNPCYFCGWTWLCPWQERGTSDG